MPTPQIREKWRGHPNAGGPTAMLLGIHDHFRAASRRLVELHTAEVRMIARVFVPLASTLHHHHHAEEAMLFPLVLRRTGIAPDQLQRDHDELTASIDAVEVSLADNQGVASAILAFHEVLIAHLDREEDLVIPVLLALSPSEVWGELQ